MDGWMDGKIDEQNETKSVANLPFCCSVGSSEKHDHS